MTADSTVRVGVTGHRFLAQVQKLKTAVEEALDRIESTFPEAPLTIISPLAEGSDRLVARAGLQRGAELVAVLPLPKDDYMTDFETAESRDEFLRLLDQATEIVQLPATGDRNQAYLQVGEYVLENSDVLIAIWDGQPGQGTGGTADIAGRALERDMPLLHIKAGNRKSGTHQPTTLGDEQGELVVHNLSSVSDGNVDEA